MHISKGISLIFSYSGKKKRDFFFILIILMNMIIYIYIVKQTCVDIISTLSDAFLENIMLFSANICLRMPFD
jgi:hypothetical protein